MQSVDLVELKDALPGMVFVIAADQDMVRDAIAMDLGGSVESSRVAQRYLDKIVQLARRHALGGRVRRRLPLTRYTQGLPP